MFVSIYILGSKNILYNQNLHYYLFVFVLQNIIIFSPFNDAKLITAQVVSFISFLFSVGNIWALVFSGITFVCLQFACCFRIDKHAMINIAILSALSGVLSIGYSINIVCGGLDTFCNDFGTPEQNGYYRYINRKEWHCPQNERTRIYLAFTGGLLSLVVSVCLFIFRDKFKRRTLADTQQQMIVPKSQASKAENERADNSSPTVSRGDNQSLNDFEIGEFEIGELEQNDEVLRSTLII
jgi:hypothetical protein